MPIDEAIKILTFFKDEMGMVIGDRHAPIPGPYVDGKKAIQWLKDEGLPGWRENEWPGFFVKVLAQFKFADGSSFRPLSIKKTHRIQGHYLWDIRFHNIDGAALIPLTDGVQFQADVLKNNGLGLIILHAQVEWDGDGSFLKWHTNLKGGQSDYTKNRRMEGIKPRQRKKGFFLLWGQAIYITPDDLKGQPWLTNNFQKGLRNSNDNPRNPKFILDLENLDRDKELVRINFNLDPKDFEEEFR